MTPNGSPNNNPDIIPKTNTFFNNSVMLINHLFIVFSIDEKPTKKLSVNRFLNKKKYIINNKNINQIK